GIPALRSANSYARVVRHAKLPLKLLVRIEQYGNWAFIDQLHGHHRLKNSCSDLNAKVAQRLIEFFVQCRRLLRRRRRNKPWPPLPARITVQRELRDHQRRTLYVEQRTIHLSLLILENA